MNQSGRTSFATKFGAVLATAGSAVGLGNVWRFPYMTGEDGGAAFILVYLVCVLMLGIPGMISEFIIGRHAGSNAARAYRRLAAGKAWMLIGVMGVLTSMIILGFYAVVAGWCLQYLYASLAGQLSGSPDYVAAYFNDFTHNPVMPAFWAVAFIFITHFVVVHGIRSGIEKVSNLLMPTLFVLLVVLVGASCMLPGAWRGVDFLLNPDFSKVSSSVFLDALGLAVVGHGMPLHLRILLLTAHQPCQDGLPDSHYRHVCSHTCRTDDIPGSFLCGHQPRFGSGSDIHHLAQRVPRGVCLNARCRLYNVGALLYAFGSCRPYIHYLYARDWHCLFSRGAALLASHRCHNRDNGLLHHSDIMRSVVRCL